MSAVSMRLRALHSHISMALTEVSRNKAFGGHLVKYQHHSDELECDMKFNVFLPKETAEGASVPGIYFLSGLTCTEDNFVQKSGALAEAAKHGVALIVPDTSPRKGKSLHKYKSNYVSAQHAYTRRCLD